MNKPTIALALLGTLGCASTQKITLECVPENVVVYVDGNALDRLPEELKLERDQYHTVFVKAEGYRPSLIVLRTEESDGEKRLSPDSLCVREHLIEMHGDLELEVED